MQSKSIQGEDLNEQDNYLFTQINTTFKTFNKLQEQLSGSLAKKILCPTGLSKNVRLFRLKNRERVCGGGGDGDRVFVLW